MIMIITLGIQYFFFVFFFFFFFFFLLFSFNCSPIKLYCWVKFDFKFKNALNGLLIWSLKYYQNLNLNYFYIIIIDHYIHSEDNYNSHFECNYFLYKFLKLSKSFKFSDS